jgi:predicted ATPase
MHLARICLENLRAHDRFEVDLAEGRPRRQVIFLGVNGSGKTTILDAVAHAFHALGGDELGAKVLSAGDVQTTEAVADAAERPTPRGAITIDAVLSDAERGVGGKLVPRAPARGTLIFPIGGQLNAVLGAERAFAMKGATEEFEDAARAASLRAGWPPCILLPANRGSLDESDDATLNDLSAYKPRDGSLSKSQGRFSLLAARLALAFLGGRASDPTGALARMWKVLAQYFPELPKPTRVVGLRLWFKNKRGSEVPLSALSDGERAILLMFGEIALRAPRDGVVMVDEVEQHLHPRWQRAVLDGLCALVPTAQFLYTTQSPYLASYAPDDRCTVGDWDHDGE